jgi:hypothetical protein
MGLRSIPFASLSVCVFSNIFRKLSSSSSVQRTYLDPNIHDTLKPRRGRSLLVCFSPKEVYTDWYYFGRIGMTIEIVRRFGRLDV